MTEIEILRSEIVALRAELSAFKSALSDGELPLRCTSFHDEVFTPPGDAGESNED